MKAEARSTTLTHQQTEFKQRDKEIYVDVGEFLLPEELKSRYLCLNSVCGCVSAVDLVSTFATTIGYQTNFWCGIPVAFRRTTDYTETIKNN